MMECERERGGHEGGGERVREREREEDMRGGGEIVRERERGGGREGGEKESEIARAQDILKK